MAFKLTVDFKKLHAVDLVGLSKTDSLQPDWFKEACAKPTILFVDEIEYLKQVVQSEPKGVI